jgi:flagellar motor component MotA
MFGTLFGLVYMLSSLDNPSAIGPGLALGLLATLYGVSSAHLIFFPLGKKVVFLSEIQRKRDEMILECASMIIAEKSALYIKDKLLSNLNLRYINNPDIPDESEEDVAIKADEEEEGEALTETIVDEKAST